MNPTLTTITPYWGRPEAFKIWTKALEAATRSWVSHFVYTIGDDWAPSSPPFITEIRYAKDVPGERSIGHYHNLGAAASTSEWIMKLDVDAIPNEEYFDALLPILRQARPKEWFNGGMMYCNRICSEAILAHSQMTLRVPAYKNIIANQRIYSMTKGSLRPAASNFICRRKEYLDLGGCDAAFRGWGWEDYQQMYMLEKAFLGRDPLPGPISVNNVTQRCRDEIGRQRAFLLFQRDSRLCLLHRWHPPSTDLNYRAKDITDQNRMVLFDYITRKNRMVYGQDQ